MSMTTGLAARQGGLGFLSFIVIIALVSFFGTALFKVGPLYMGFWTVRSIMEDMAKSYDVNRDGSSARAIVASLEKRLDVNSVTHVKYTDFKVERLDERRFKLILNYEQRVHLFFNIDVVVVFAHQVELGSR
ncbi:MAG: DUF4845 domain-containing protein [Thermochromatium sp.]